MTVATFEVNVKQSKISEISICHTKANSLQKDYDDMMMKILNVFVAAAIFISQYIRELCCQIKAVNGRADKFYRILLLVCSCRIVLRVLMFLTPFCVCVCFAKSVEGVVLPWNREVQFGGVSEWQHCVQNSWRH
jgi:hypothetical protein